MEDEKVLLLVRHAKSSHEIPFLEDKLRPLASRGKTDSQLIGQRLHELSLVAQDVYCSSAVRTKATLALLNKSLKIPQSSISFHDTLYTFHDDGSTYLSYLQSCSNTINQVMMLSHNNSCVNVANRVSGGEIISFPTCAVLICRWKIASWSEANWANINSYQLLTPKQLK